MTELVKLPKRWAKLGLDGAFRILCLGCWRVDSRYVKGSDFDLTLLEKCGRTGMC